MRILELTAIFACALPAPACDRNDSKLIEPVASLRAAAVELASLASPGEDGVRIVEPGDGQTVKTGAEFVVRARQELREGPAQGRGQLQLARAGEDWEDFGRPFPWTRQGPEFRVGAVISEPGYFRLRLVAYGEHSQLPFLESPEILVESSDVVPCRVFVAVRGPET